MRSGLVLGVVLGVSAVALLPAQQPVFRAGTDYVQLDVIATDADNHAVRDLTKADFEITEGGRAQTLTDLQFVAIPPTHRTVVDTATTAQTIDVVTNAHAPTSRQWVMVIDDLHIIETHLRQTKQVVQEFLEQLPAGDQVAIVFVARSDLSQDFTSDLGAQMRTVNRIRGALGLACDAANICGSTVPGAASEATPLLPTKTSTTPATVDSIADKVGPLGDPAQRDRHRFALATVEVLKNVSASLVRSTYPRKAMVYVSEGLTYSLDNTFHSDYLDFSRDTDDARDVMDQMKETFETARRAGVPVYTIDPRGLPDCTSVRGSCETLPWDNIRNQFNSMRTLAETTGGLAFVGGADLSRSVRELVDDNNSFYVLGYYPQPFERDGKFHDVKVTVKRPGVRVRARAGYESPKPAAPNTVVETRRTLEEALAAAAPAPGLSLRALAAPIAPGLHGMKTVVTVEVTYPTPPDGSKIADDLQFGILALDRDGKTKSSARHAFHFTGSAHGAAEVTYAINDVIELPSQPLILRVAVASQALGKAGAIHVPVEPISPSHDELQLAAIVIGLDGPAREAAVPPGVLKDLLPFQPTTARTFATSDTLRVFAPVFWSSKDPAAIVTVSVRGGSNVLVQRNGQANAAPAGSGHRQAAYIDALPLIGLAAGNYVVRVDAKLADGQSATREVAIEIR